MSIRKGVEMDPLSLNDILAHRYQIPGIAHFLQEGGADAARHCGAESRQNHNSQHSSQHGPSPFRVVFFSLMRTLWHGGLTAMLHWPYKAVSL